MNRSSSLHWQILGLVSALTLPAAHAQQLVPSSQGFTYGSTTGSTSFYRQEVRNEANVLQQVLTQNAAPIGPDLNLYSITDPRAAFSVIDLRQSQTGGESKTTVGGSAITGANYSVFSN